MNERIKDMLAEATEIRDDWKTGISRSVIDYNLFAELIVNHAVECVRDVAREENSPLTWEGCSRVQARIREFFGI